MAQSDAKIPVSNETMDRGRSVSPELHANFSWSAAVREELAAIKKERKRQG